MDYIVVFLGSAFKFVFGPTLGKLYQLHPLATIVCTICGMMFTVTLVSILGRRLIDGPLSKYLKRKKLFSPRTRQLVNVWNKYGIYGVAFLTPLLLMPIGGAIISVSFREKPLKIITYMFFSAIFWAFTMTYAWYYFSDQLIKFWNNLF